MSWRSTLKSKAREIVPRFYELGDDLPAAENKALAQTLIRGSTFTFHGVDEEVRPEHFFSLLLTYVAGIDEQYGGSGTRCADRVVFLQRSLVFGRHIPRCLRGRSSRSYRLFGGDRGTIFLRFKSCFLTNNTSDSYELQLMNTPRLALVRTASSSTRGTPRSMPNSDPCNSGLTVMRSTRRRRARSESRGQTLPSKH